MSTEPSEVLKPKRKYTRRAKPDTTPVTPIPAHEIPASSPEYIHVPSSEAPAHSMPCCVVTGSYIEKSPLNEEMIRKFNRCGEESKWVPKIVFKGRHFIVRKDEEGKPISVRAGKVFTMPVIWQPVCEKHKHEIQKNAGILLTNQWINSQTRSFIDMGFPSPEAEMTKMVWSPYVYEEPEVQNDILDVLARIANERAELVKEQGFTNIQQEDA